METSASSLCPSCGATVQTETITEATPCPNCGTLIQPASATASPVEAAVTDDTDQLIKRFDSEPTVAPKRLSWLQLVAIFGIIVAVGVGLFFATQKEEVFAEAHSPNDGHDHGTQMTAADSARMEQQMIAVNNRIDSLQHIVEDNPSDHGAKLTLANTYYDVGRWEDAKTAYATYLESNPKDVDARVDYAYAMVQASNDPGAGIGEIEKALTYNPNHVNALFNAGVLSLQLRGEDHAQSLAKAKVFFERAKVAAAKENPALVPQIEKILLEMDNVKKRTTTAKDSTYK